MDIHSWLIKNVTFPLWMMKDGTYEIAKMIDHFDYINKSSIDEIEKKQIDKLKSLLEDAAINCPYYNSLFKNLKFDPAGIVSLNDLHDIPILTKTLIRRNFSELRSKSINAKDLSEASTGGSTGVPLKFLRDNRALPLRKAQEYFFDKNFMGYYIGEKIGYFVSHSHYVGSISNLKAAFRNNTCERMLSYDPHEITDDYLQKFTIDYLKYKPTFIKCFPNALMPFAQYLSKKGIRTNSVRAVSCTGEMLYPYQRKLFEKVFGSTVFEKVGTRESGVFASECEAHDGLHIFSPGVIVELIKPDGTIAKAGEIGKVIITDLFNRAMPLIRYEIGDMALAMNYQPCSCGCPLPRIRKYMGRTRDICIDENGNPKPGYLFVEEIRSMNLQSQFQFIQPDRKSFIVNVIRNDDEEINTNDVVQRVKKIIGNKVNVEVNYVSTIPRDPSGKYCYVISKIKAP